MKDKFVLSETKSILRFCYLYLCIPLFLIFWSADHIYAPSHKWIFLILRLLSFPVFIFAAWYVNKTNEVLKVQRSIIYCSLFSSIVLNFMIFFIEGPISSYFDGLLIILVIVTCVPWQRIRDLAVCVGTIFVPYLVGCLFYLDQSKQFDNIVIKLHFIFSIVLVTMFQRKILGDLRTQRAENYNLIDQFNEVALQVAHDIRSPLVAIKAGISSLQRGNTSGQELIIASLNRIELIAEGLTEKYKKASADKSGSDLNSKQISSLVDLVNSIVIEKKIEYLGRSHETRLLFNPGVSDFNIFLSVDSSDFKRILSNLINNSFEASSTEIMIVICSNSDNVSILIQDNGKGIPDDVMPRLMQKGISYNKQKGTGLGLSYAKDKLLSWNGSIDLKSKLDFGTSINLTIPKSSETLPYVDQLEICPNTEIVIIDDDLSIHESWKRIFITKKIVLPIHHFTTFGSFNVQAEKLINKKCLYLIDYNFNIESEDGLALIQKHKLNSYAVLVTTMAYSEKVLKKCKFLNVKILPKSLISIVPITFKP